MTRKRLSAGPPSKNWFAPKVLEMSHSYYDHTSGMRAGDVFGESVTFTLSQAGKTLAERGWDTEFPPGAYTFELSKFVAARVHGEDLLAELLHNAAFTQDDLAELSSSEIPEVRLAAVGSLTD